MRTETMLFAHVDEAEAVSAKELGLNDDQAH